MRVKPVIFPPGGERLAGTPRRTGSIMAGETIGMWPLGSTALAATAPPSTTITSTGRATSSAASCGPRERLPWVNRNSRDDIATFDIAEVTEPLPECVEDCRPLAVRHRKDADARDFRLQLLSGRLFGREKQSRKP